MKFFKTSFALLSILLLSVFFAPGSALAILCVYQGETPEDPPQCTEFLDITEFQATNQCKDFCKTVGGYRWCGPMDYSIYPSCLEYVRAQEAKAAAAAPKPQAAAPTVVDGKLDLSANPLAGFTASTTDLNKLQSDTAQGFIGLVIKTATGIMGTIALCMLIYGGLLWMTSSGNSAQVDKAQHVIFYGALGVFVIFGSYAIITFIFQAVNPVALN